MGRGAQKRSGGSKGPPMLGIRNAAHVHMCIRTSKAGHAAASALPGGGVLPPIHRAPGDTVDRNPPCSPEHGGSSSSSSSSCSFSWDTRHSNARSRRTCGTRHRIGASPPRTRPAALWLPVGCRKGPKIPAAGAFRRVRFLFALSPPPTGTAAIAAATFARSESVSLGLPASLSLPLSVLSLEPLLLLLLLSLLSLWIAFTMRITSLFSAVGCRSAGRRAIILFMVWLSPAPTPAHTLRSAASSCPAVGALNPGKIRGVVEP